MLSEHPDGVYATEEVLAKTRETPSNPFELPSTPPLSSPSSSVEELYTDAISLVTPTVVLPPKKPPPPAPPPRNTKPIT